MMKRFLTLMIALLLVLCAIPMAASAEERPTLTILMAQDTYVEDYETNAFTKFIEDSMNVNLDFVLLPASDASDKLAVMIQSGQELPDIINYSLDVTTTYRYAQAGAIIPLNDYYETLGDNVKKVEELVPGIYEYIRCPDGNLYSIPTYTKGLHDEHKYKIWINKVWLDNLKLEIPTTTEELYTVLKAFKEQDPNGNGIQDEYPLVGGTGWSQDPTIYLMNSFIHTDDGDRLIVEGGKVDVVYNREAWKKGLEYMRRLVDEKLLDPISFTQDDSQLRAMANNEGTCIVGAFAFSSITLMPVATGEWVHDYVCLAPVEGPDGVRLAYYQPTIPTNRWFITADCKDPELAFKVGDFMFDPTEEVFLRARFGVEGEHWSRPQEGDVTAWGDEYPPMYRQDINIWTVSQNAHWRNNAPLYADKACQGGVYSEELSWWDKPIAEGVMAYVACDPAPGTFVPTLNFTEEETDEISEIRATLKTYVKESMIRFITRDMDLDTEWDKYVEELNNIGVEKFVTVCQQAYDRMYK